MQIAKVKLKMNFLTFELKKTTTITKMDKINYNLQQTSLGVSARVVCRSPAYLSLLLILVTLQ